MLCLLIFSRPFLVMRTQSSFNHAGPDEEPTAILLRKPALEATVGNDPTIGGPARVRTGPDRSFRNECIIPIRANTRVGKGAQSHNRSKCRRLECAPCPRVSSPARLSVDAWARRAHDFAHAVRPRSAPLPTL